MDCFEFDNNVKFDRVFREVKKGGIHGLKVEWPTARPAQIGYAMDEVDTLPHDKWMRHNTAYFHTEVFQDTYINCKRRFAYNTKAYTQFQI